MNAGFTRLSAAVARWTGTAWAFALVIAGLAVWLLLGPSFHWSTGWQLAANVVTTLITFVMVFVIQATQNRHSAAMQLKLDELLKSSEHARDQLIGADLLSQAEIDDHRSELQGGGGAPER
ncbi:MAG: low affinity iron permease family protein [Planctomycetaceae bacterium]